jgi:hypothetical protein
MRLLAAMTCVVLACLAPAAVAPAKKKDVPGPGLKATVSSCTTGPLATDRNATFVGSMTSVKGAARMEMRFDLLQLRPGDVYTRVAVPKWGAWVRSAPGVPSFSYERRIEQLAAPAFYRVQVRYRWRDASGAVIRRDRRRSPVCEQPDFRPDLEIGAIKAAPGEKGASRYDIVVRNIGRSDVSTPFEVTLGNATETIGSAGLTSLMAGATQTVSITAPPCSAGQRLQVVVDAGGTVDEATERNNKASRTCPGTA